MLTAERARELFDYDPETGTLFRILSYRKPCDPRPMRVKDTDGYIVVKADGAMYKAHRVAWLMAHGSFPEKILDHINGVKDDNRLCNLREVTPAQNQHNRKVMHYATSGLKGASFNRRDKKWQATIRKNGRSVNLGTFDTAEEAHLAYCREASKLFGEHFCDGKRA